MMQTADTFTRHEDWRGRSVRYCFPDGAGWCFGTVGKTGPDESDVAWGLVRFEPESVERCGYSMMAFPLYRLELADESEAA